MTLQTDVQTASRLDEQTGVSQYPHFFFEKRRDNKGGVCVIYLCMV